MSTSSEVQITPGQASKLGQLVSNRILDRGLPSAHAQHVMETRGAVIACAMADAAQAYIEASTGEVVRSVVVNYARSTYDSVVRASDQSDGFLTLLEGAPKAVYKEGRESMTVTFFRADTILSKDGLSREFQSRSLVPAAAQVVAKAIEDEPSLPLQLGQIETKWQNASGWFSLVFSGYGSLLRPGISAHCIGVDGGDVKVAGLWYAGVSKDS